MKFKLVLLALLIPFMNFAQMPEQFRGEHFIEVTGTAQQEIEPNEIYTVIRLREFEENREKTTLEKLDKDFFNAMKDAGIDRKRIELADVGSKLDKLSKREKDSFRDKTYQIKLTSGAELDKVMEKLQSVKIDFADVTRVHHTDLEKIRMDLKVKALQVARAKAETLLKSIGSEVGKPLMVRDWDMEPVQPMMKTANVYMRTEGAADEEAPIGFRKIRLQTQITAQFEIK